MAMMDNGGHTFIKAKFKTPVILTRLWIAFTTFLCN